MTRAEPLVLEWRQPLTEFIDQSVRYWRRVSFRHYSFHCVYIKFSAIKSNN
ncbi:hypothetical protein PANN_49960 [Pseudomonas aeruginosa C-NN2]|nr:hypothetical protein PANN_49960 [Pseudomonas aeruginosa C-NN2]